MGTLQNMRARFLQTLVPLIAGSTILISLVAFMIVYQNARAIGATTVQQNAQVLLPIQRQMTMQLERRMNTFGSLADRPTSISPTVDEVILLIDDDNVLAWDQTGTRSIDDDLTQLLATSKPSQPLRPSLHWRSINHSLWLVGTVTLPDGRRLVVAQYMNERLPTTLQQFGESEIFLVSPELVPIYSTWRSSNGTQIPPIGIEIDEVRTLQPGMHRPGYTTFLVPDYRGHLRGNVLYNAHDMEISVFVDILPITDPETQSIAAYGIWALPSDSFFTTSKVLFGGAALLSLLVAILSWIVISRVTNRQLGTLRQLKEKTHALVDAFEEDLPTDARYEPITDHGSTEVTGILRAVGRLEEVVEQRNKLESELQQAQKMESIGRLAGGIAHDFNNLLTVIVANCELLVSESQGSSKPVLQEILKAGRRAENLTRQLLAFSRRQVLDMQNVDLNQAVGEIDDLLRRLVGARMRFSIGIQPNLGLVYADAGQLHQVMMNLCVNARDATPRGGRIEMSITNFTLRPGQLAGRPSDAQDVPPGDYIRIAVVDTGSGIPDDVQQRIFEPFFTTKSVNEGTGLGLSVVKGIVEQSAGFIGISSAIDEGTTVAVYLPRVEGVAGFTADSSPKPIPTGTGTVLLVEDEDLVRSAIRRVLRRAGYDVLVAAAPHQALEMCREHADQIDLILTDVIMPDMTGIELINEVKQQQPAIATIFMSGYPGDEIARHGRFEDRGMLIQKPVNPQELIQLIQTTLLTS